MTSFVAQVLAEQERVKMEDLEQESNCLINDALSLKHDYLEALESHYLNLLKPLNSTPYFDDFERLNNSWRLVSDALQEAKPMPTFSELQLENLSATIEEIKGYINLLKQLTDQDRTLISAKLNYENKNFLECAKNLGCCRSLFGEEPCSTEVTGIIDAMKRNWKNICGSLMYDLTNTWREYISFKDIPRSSVRSSKVVRVNVSQKHEEQFLIAVKAMKYVDLQDHMFRTLGSMLLEHVFKPLVEHECIVQKANSTMCTSGLEVIIKVNSSSPTYAIVLHNSKRVFEFLNEYINQEVSANTKVLNMVGRFIDRKFCKLTFKMKFFDNKDIKKFTADVFATEVFKRYLCEIGFIQFDVLNQGKQIPEMFDYLQNCSILEEARSLMHKKLHETVTVKQIFSPKHQHYKSLLNKTGTLSNDDLEGWKMIPSQLRISKSTQDLMDKVEHLLDVATKREKFESVRLFYTVKNIFDMYDILLPSQCQELAKNNAYFSGIIFNNCSHLCEWIISLGPKYYDYFPRMSDSTVVTFAREALKIRESGARIFQTYVESQIDLLTGQISESDFREEDCSNHEETMENYLNTIENLKSTWGNLLAYHIYLKTMGEIISSVMKQWTKKILAMESISSDLAVCLRVMIKDVTTMLNSSEEEISCKKYREKLNSIQMVLEGNAFEIIHKWQRGNGPLAESLTAKELKSLIKSLFTTEEMVYILNSIQ